MLHVKGVYRGFPKGKQNKLKRGKKRKSYETFFTAFLKPQQGEKAIILSWKIDLKQAVAGEGCENAREQEASKETRATLLE